MDKKAQSEIAGFGIIVIIVAILIVIFISFALNSKPNSSAQSYESEAFVQSYLQFTTQCQKNSNYQSILELIKLCESSSLCDDNQNSCKVLNETSKAIVENSWPVGNDLPVKGYELLVLYQGKNLILLSDGNKTSDLRGSQQTFSGDLEIDFTSYY